MVEIEDLHPNWLTDSSIFTLKIGHQNFPFSIDFIRSRHNSLLVCYLQEIISILEKICPNMLKRLLTFNLFMTV